MPRIPGIDDGSEVYFGFTKHLPDFRSQERAVDPAAVSAIIGFDTADLDSPPDSPAILVRRARKHGGGELVPAFETAASLPLWMPPELHADAWKQAGRLAAADAIERPEAADALQSLAKGALRYARKYARRAKSVVHPCTTAEVIEATADVIDAAKEEAVASGEYEQAAELRQQYVAKRNVPVRRWRDARGMVHAPKPPKATCVEQDPGPRGGRIWDCGGGAKSKENGQGTDKAKKEPSESPKPENKATPSRGPEPEIDKAAKLTIAQANNLIQKTRENPTKEKVAALAVMLARLPKEQLRLLKRQQGVRADDNTKTGLANKIAKAATIRLTQREHWMQEARKVGVRPEDMLLASRDIREAYNHTTDTVNKMVTEARETYAKQFGKLITRRMKAFDGGDHNQIRGFDVLARQMAERYPELLGAHGYSAEGGVDPNSEEAAQKLFGFFAAGKLPRMTFGESQKQAIDFIKSGNRKPAEEATPFQRQGEAVHA